MSVSSEQVMDTLDSLQQQWTTFREQEFGGQDAALVASDRAAPPSHAANGGLPPHENGGAGPSQMPSQPSSFQAPVAASPSLALKTLSRQLLREVESTRQEYAKQNEVLLQETEVLKQSKQSALQEKSMAFRQVSDSRRELQEVRAVLDKLKLELQRTERRKDLVAGDVSQQEGVLQRTRRQADEHERRLAVLRQSIQQEEAIHKQWVGTQEKEILSRELDLAKREERVKVSEDLVRSCKAKETELDDKTRDLAAKRLDLERKVQEFKSHVAGLEHDVSSMERRLKGAKEECAELDARKRALQDKVAASERELGEKAARLERELGEISATAERKLNETKRQHGDLEVSLHRKKEELRDVERDAATKGAAAVELSKKVTTLEATVAEGKIDLAEKQEALRLVSRENERAEEMLERTQKENVKLQESLNGTKAQIAHMTFEYKEWKMKFEDDKSKATKELDALSEATKKTLLEEQELVRKELEAANATHKAKWEDWERRMAEGDATHAKKTEELRAIEQSVMKRAEALKQAEAEYDKAYSEVSDRLSALEQMEFQNIQEHKELQRKAEGLVAHENQLKAWKEQIETETIAKLKAKAHELSEKEDALSTKEAYMKDALRDLDARQADVQKGEAEVAHRLEKIDKATTMMEERRQNLELKWTDLHKKEVELEAQAARLASSSEELERKEGTLTMYEQEIESKQNALQAQAHEVQQGRAAIEKEQHRLAMLQDKLHEQGQQQAEKMSEQIANCEKEMQIAMALKAEADEKDRQAQEDISRAESTLEAAAAWEEQKEQQEASLKQDLLHLSEEKRIAERLSLQATQQQNAINASRESLKSIEHSLQQRENQMQSAWRHLKSHTMANLQSSTDPLAVEDIVLSELVSMTFPMNGVHAPPDLESLESHVQDVALMEFATNIYHHWGQLINQESKLQKWAHALQVEVGRCEKRMQEARHVTKEATSKQATVSDQIAELEKLEISITKRENDLRSKEQTMSRREKKSEDACKFLKERERNIAEMEMDVESRWRDLEKQRYESDQVKAKHDREWADAKHAIDKAKNMEYDVQKDRDANDRENQRLRELRHHLESEKSDILDQSAKAKLRAEKLEQREQSVLARERDLESERQRRLEQWNVKDLQISKMKHEIEQKKLFLEDESGKLQAREITIKTTEETLAAEKAGVYEMHVACQAKAEELKTLKARERAVDEREAMLQETTTKAENMLIHAEQERLNLEREKKGHLDSIKALQDQMEREKERLDRQEMAVLDMAKQVTQAKSNADSAIQREKGELEGAMTHLKSEHQKIVEEMGDREARIKAKETELEQREEAVGAQEASVGAQLASLRAREDDIVALETSLKQSTQSHNKEFEHRSEELRLLQQGLEKKLALIAEQRENLVSKEDAVSNLEQEMRQEFMQAHEQHMAEKAEQDEHAQRLVTQEAELASRSKDIEAEAATLADRVAKFESLRLEKEEEFETKLRMVNDQLSEIKQEEQRLQHEKQEMLSVKEKMAGEISNFKQEIKAKEDRIEAREANAAAMEQRARDTCDQLLAVITEENESLGMKQKLFEEEESNLKASVEAHQKAVASLEEERRAIASSRDEASAFAQATMQTLEQEKERLALEKRDLMAAIAAEAKSLDELKASTDKEKRLKAKREAQLGELEEGIDATSKNLARLKAEEHRLVKVHDKYDEFVALKKSVSKEKEQISMKLIELDRKQIIIGEIQEKVSEKETKAKAERAKIEGMVNEINDKERTIRTLHRRLRVFEDDLKGKEAQLEKKSAELADAEASFRKQTDAYQANKENSGAQLNQLQVVGEAIDRSMLGMGSETHAKPERDGSRAKDSIALVAPPHPPSCMPPIHAATAAFANLSFLPLFYLPYLSRRLVC